MGQKSSLQLFPLDLDTKWLNSNSFPKSPVTFSPPKPQWFQWFQVVPVVTEALHQFQVFLLARGHQDQDHTLQDHRQDVGGFTLAFFGPIGDGTLW